MDEADAGADADADAPPLRRRAAPPQASLSAPPGISSSSLLSSPPPTGDGKSRPLLSATGDIGYGELYSDDERILSEMLKTHPMLSMEATSPETLQLVASMSERAVIKVPEVPIVPKSYDDTYLRPANTRIGERQCSCEESCICALMARVRHGPETDLAFVGTEFLLPKERDKFFSGGGLPPQRGKCLLCTRYWQNYAYIRARTDPHFRLGSGEARLQILGSLVPKTARANSETVFPRNASVVASHDGYHAHAMLFVDEGFVDATRVAREESGVGFLWHPVVRFCSSHYRYTRSSGTGAPSIVQVGIGHDLIVSSTAPPDFGAPSASMVAPLAACSLAARSRLLPGLCDP